jgi:O-antigen/teichoic acid export membrane protein
MKVLVQRITDNPNYARVLEWGKLVSITGSAQIVVQAIGFISGILVIRLLPTKEYALYTLANTMLGTMTVLADGGISTGVMAEGGKVWQDHKKLGGVLATGLYLRKKFATLSLIIATPALLYLLRHHGASWLMSILIIISIIPTFFTILSGTILEVAPKLRQDIASLQKINVWTNVGRLSFLGLTIFTFPLAFVAIIASAIPQVWANGRIRKISSHYAKLDQEPDPIVRREVLLKVKRMLPLSIYYCLSGQVTIWLLSIFGSTTSIAQVGALGRFSLMLGVVSTLFNVLIVPRFSRLPNAKFKLISWYLVAQLMLVIISVLIMGIVVSFPNQILWILGKDYVGLTNEVLLTIAASCINMVASSSFALYSHRGLVMRPVLGISIGVIGIITAIFIIDVSTLHGALLYNLFIATFSLIINFSYGLGKLWNVEDQTLVNEQMAQIHCR